MISKRGRLVRIEACIRKLEARREQEQLWSQQKDRIKRNELNAFEQAMLGGLDEEDKPFTLAFCESIQHMARIWNLDLPGPEEICQHKRMNAEFESSHGHGFHLDITQEW